MPEICRFYGIVIKMYFRQAEHDPPHFHALYNDKMATFDINTQKVIIGDLPQKAIAIVQEWAKIHKNELLKIWNNQKFIKIKPIE